MSALAVVVLIGLSTLIFWVGMIKLLFIPLSLYFEIRQTWRNHRKVKTALDDEPLVSIIVPGYNEEKVLGACISSILASSYQHFELIMVNDGSTDSTAKDAGPRRGQPLHRDLCRPTKLRQRGCAEHRHRLRQW